MRHASTGARSVLAALSIAPLRVRRSAERRGRERSGRPARRDVRVLPPPRRQRPGHSRRSSASTSRSSPTRWQAFKSGERPSQIMHAVALSLSDEEIASVGALSRRATKRTGAAMKCWTRRQFGCLAGAALPHGARPARGARPSQGASRRDRRRHRRRDGRQISGGERRSDRRDAGRAEAALYDLLLQQPLSRRPALARFAHAWLRGAGATIRHQRHPRYRGGDRSGGEDGRSQERRQAALRPAGARPGHRLQIRRHRGLRRGGDRDHAACLECRAADRAAAPAARKHGGRRRFRDRRPARTRSAARPAPTSARRWSPTISSSSSRSRRS